MRAIYLGGVLGKFTQFIDRGTLPPSDRRTETELLADPRFERVYDHMAGPRRALPRIERLAGKKAEDAVLGDET